MLWESFSGRRQRALLPRTWFVGHVMRQRPAADAHALRASCAADCSLIAPPMHLPVHVAQAWTSVFPKEQLLWLRTEDYKAAPAEHIQALIRFLGVPAALVSSSLLPAAACAGQGVCPGLAAIPHEAPPHVPKGQSALPHHARPPTPPFGSWHVPGAHATITRTLAGMHLALQLLDGPLHRRSRGQPFALAYALACCWPRHAHLVVRGDHDDDAPAPLQ
jgi:hypothetical protein